MSDKVNSSEKLTLLHENKVITNDDEIAKILNSYFFYNVVIQFKIAEFKGIDFSAERISHPAFKAIMKFPNHPSVSGIRNAFNKVSVSQ